MNRFAFLFLILLFTSCDYFEKKKVNAEDLLKEELNTFNWNDVDTYPTFSNCNSITDKSASKLCFQTTLLNSVNDYLENQNIVVSENVNDTIRLKIIIDNKGSLSIASISVKEETKFQIPEIDSLLRQSLKDISKIYPAIKRGQQVTTAFELPVIVKID
ncbi:hypothetical protein [uncultured Winogradskyella sp.]|uniref:hypothetical protein n=1 Tax=uncultured Winogradskyella sp. TaxID=395353 RepID=UPI0026077B91|nr:hypothetical protein [uncultured Winogradskyella sp.]